MQATATKPRSYGKVEDSKKKTLPAPEKTYLFKELYIETIIRNPKKGGLFGCR